MTPTPRYRAVAIGHTGRGNYGHYIETSFAEVPDVELVAVADPDEAGRAAARSRTGATRDYVDYRAMLECERPDLALVCPRWCDDHAEMLLACVDAGVRGIYSEKPLIATLAEADAVLSALQASNVKVVVAHRSREIPHLQWARRQIAAGDLGRLEVMRTHGKGDHRVGGQDMAVLAQHLFDHMLYIAGAPSWVSGYVTERGRPITRADARVGDEGVGLIAGDRISATFGFADGVVGHYESYPTDRAGAHWYGIELHCSNAIIALRNLPVAEVYIYPHGAWLPATEAGAWEPVRLPEWHTHPGGQPRRDADYMRESNRRHVLSLIRAIEEGAEPVDTTTAAEAIAIQEMIVGIYSSHLVGARMALPLVDRGDPLAQDV